MLKRGSILILMLAICGVAVARAISIVHSRADRIHDHEPRVWRFGSVETTWHSRPRLCSAEGGRLIEEAFDLRSNTAGGGCAARGAASYHGETSYAEPPSARDFGSKMRQIAGTNPATVKHWALDEVAFRNAHGDRAWIIGRSDRPAMSDLEAIESAHADAARAICVVIRSRVQAWPGDRRWLESHVDSQVNAGLLDADTSVERFDRPYGSVYAASVLLDASADRMEPLLRDVQLGLMARHRLAGIHLAIAGGLLILTWLGYVLLNSITRGYVTGRLRWIAAGMTFGVLLLA